MARGAAAALVLLMLIVLVDVIGRDVFNRPLPPAPS
jgi:TRAP-type C4-dicarboxylate transport system permease small subunit